MLEVANDVFNYMGVFGLVVLLRCAQSAVWHCLVESSSTITVSCEWSIGPTQHCSHTITVCPHILLALNVLHICTSYRPMMTLGSAALGTCVSALETGEPGCVGRFARLFFMLEVHDPHEAVRHVMSASEPSR
jgi:hypothetical protein